MQNQLTQIESNNRRILRERAERLSRIIKEQDRKTDYIEIVPFKLGQEQFALETQYIKEVFPLKNYTPVPCAPAFLYGVTNVRREIIPIIDLKVFFSLSDDKTSDYKLVIIANQDTELAILTNGFGAIKIVAKDELQITLPTLTGIRQDFLKGLLKNGTVILDGKKLLTSPHLVIEENNEDL